MSDKQLALYLRNLNEKLDNAIKETSRNGVDYEKLHLINQVVYGLEDDIALLVEE